MEFRCWNLKSMAVSNFSIVTILLALIFSQSCRADAWIEREGEDFVEVVRSDGLDSSSLKLEMHELQSKIQKLESQVDEKTQELKRKDEVIAQKEKDIEDKSDSISSLQSEVSSLQKKGETGNEEQVGKAFERASELEKQVDELKRKLEKQSKEIEVWEARSEEDKKKIRELNSKLENLERINGEQKTKIRKSERAIKAAKKEMAKAKAEAASKIKELTEVHGAWLPPWLASHWDRCQSFTEAQWQERVKPSFDFVIHKALEKKARAEKWIEPHVETVKSKLEAAMKEKLVDLRTKAEPHVQALGTKTIQLYKGSKTVITPHIIRVQEFVDPYYQEVKKISKPYMDRVSTAAKPHVEKAKVVLKPYTKKFGRVYRKFLKSATAYHHQVQGTVREILNGHELTKPFATKEFEWFIASAVLALPIIILSNILSSIFGKKSRKRTRNANSSHARRKAKREHPDK